MDPGMTGAGGTGLWWVVGLALVLVVIAAAVTVRAVRARDRLRTGRGPTRGLEDRPAARRLLDDRYARGELDTEEYRERVITLDDQS